MIWDAVVIPAAPSAIHGTCCAVLSQAVFAGLIPTTRATILVANCAVFIGSTDSVAARRFTSRAIRRAHFAVFVSGARSVSATPANDLG